MGGLRLGRIPLGGEELAILPLQRTTPLEVDLFVEGSREVEEAIDWLSGGKLRKTQPTDVLGYLRHHGPAPLSEVQRAFGLTPEAAMQKVTGLEKSGDAKMVTLAGGSHWQAAR